MYKDYNMNQLTLPLDIEVMIPDDDIAVAVNEMVESIPEAPFKAFEHDVGASSYHPRMMKIILCGYAQSMWSGRENPSRARRQPAHDLIDADAIFIDGTKLEANANKYTFVFRKSVEKHQEKLRAQSRLMDDTMHEQMIIPALLEESESLVTAGHLNTMHQALETVEA